MSEPKLVLRAMKIKCIRCLKQTRFNFFSNDSVFMALNSVWAPSSWTSVFASSILFERELHLVIKSLPDTSIRAFQLYPHSSSKTPAGSNVNPAWKSAKESFQVFHNSSRIVLIFTFIIHRARMICFLSGWWCIDNIWTVILLVRFSF